MNSRTLDLYDGNLKVRPLKEADLPCLLEWLTDERVLKFYEGRDTRWDEQAVHEHYFSEPDHDAEFLRTTIELDRRPIGYGQIYRLYGDLYDEYQVPDTGGVVYAMDQFIGVPELWDVGIGTRYVRMVTDWLVRERKAAAVVMDPRKNNPRAVRCYQKAGYEIVAELPAHELHEGTFEDCYLMRYTAPERSWDDVMEEHAAAYFTADIALEDPDSYTLEEKKTIVERMQTSTDEVEMKMRKEFQAMTTEEQQMMLEMLIDSPQGIEWWERVLLNFDNLPDAPPEKLL